MSARVNTETDQAPAAIGPYSQAIAHDGLLYCSGAVPLDPGGELVGADDPAEQARQCLRNLQAVCESAGASLSHAVRCGIYVTDMGTFGEVNEVYATFFAEPQPARSTIGVAALPLGAQVEIDAIVALGG